MMHISKTFILIFILTGYSGLSQDWKSLYEESKQAYTAGQYEQALASANKAYDQAKKIDPKTTAYSLQLLTTICLDGDFAQQGLQFVEEEAKIFLDLEGQNSKHYYEAKKKHVRLLQLAGQLSLAAENNASLNELAMKSFGESYEYYSSCFNYAQLLLQLNQFKESQEVWNACLQKLKEFPEGNEDYFYGLFYSAFVDNKLGAWQDSYRKWTEFISLADQNNLQDLEEYKQAKSFLAGLQNKGLASTSAAASDGKSIQDHLTSARDHHNKKQFDEAAREYADAEKKILDGKVFSNTTYSIYLNYARLLFQQNKKGEAYLRLNEAKKIADKLYPVNAPEHGYLNYLEAELNLSENKINDAGQLYIRAITNLSSVAPEIFINYVTNAGRAMLNANKPDLALELMKISFVHAEMPLGDKQKIDFITTYCDILEQLNQHDAAITYLKEKIALGGTTQTVLKIKLAEALKESGRWQEAVDQLESLLNSLDITEDAKAEASYQLARAQQLLGKYVSAEKHYLTALNLSTKLKSENTLQVSNSLGTFYTQLGNFEAAERIYVDALKESVKGTFGNTLKQNLASVYQQTNRLAEAQQLLEQVVQSEKESMSADYAISLQNLAALYQKSENYEKAKVLYIQALEIDKRYFGEQSLSYATKMANLGAVYQENGELVKARLLLESALKIREAKLGTEHPDYVFNQYNLAVLFQRIKEPQLALPLFRKVSTFYTHQIRELFPAMSEQEKTAFYNKIQEVINAYQDFAIENAAIDKSMPSELLDFRLQTKALLLNSSAAVRNRILSSGNPALMAKFTDWLQTKEQLALLFSLPFAERSTRKNNEDALLQKANTIEKELSAQSELFASALEKSTVTWRNVQAALNPGEAVIEMIRLRLNLKNDSVIYVALIVKPGIDIPIMVTMQKGRSMEKRQFSYYRNTIRYKYLNEISHQTYWKPLEPHLSDVKTIYFSPDGIYNKINLVTLYDTEKKQYLIDRFSVKLVSNPKDIILKENAMAAPLRATLIGFPDYVQNAAENHTNLPMTEKEPSAAFELVRGGIEALPGTKEEVLMIEKLLKSNQWDVHAYLFEKATEEITKNQQSPTLLHIATHGFFISPGKNESEIIPGHSILQAENNPLLRSGLLMAGAEKNLVLQLLGRARIANSEDGVLTAYEAMNMNLQNTNLVVLSACETGAGEVRNGEGVYGLQRAFLVAGANSVMMSLWKVSDEATQELMVVFYQNWLKLKDKRQAFHQTQLQLREKYQDPFDWGAFVMIGK